MPTDLKNPLSHVGRQVRQVGIPGDARVNPNSIISVDVEGRAAERGEEPLRCCRDAGYPPRLPHL